MLKPSFFTPISEPAGRQARLFIVVDTEEEFDWSAPFARENVSVTAIQEVGRLQRVVARYGLKPTYVVDYPVAATAASSAALATIAHQGECRGMVERPIVFRHIQQHVFRGQQILRLRADRDTLRESP